MSKKIKIASARLSFPSLFHPAAFDGESTGKYEATFILDKVEHADVISEIQAQANALMKAELKTKLGADRICLKDGDESGRDEYANAWTLKAATKKRPLVLNRDKSPIAEEDGVIYSGCYVHAIVSLWAQNNRYGKRINAQLDGIQFVKDGEPFGEGGINAEEFDDFDDFDDEAF